MPRNVLKSVIGLSFLLVASSSVMAFPAPSERLSAPSETIQVANGCGGGRYRGPEGACHAFGTGPFPRGYNGPYRANWNGCRAGWYRGPGGACHRYGYGPYPGGYHGPYR